MGPQMSHLLDVAGGTGWGGCPLVVDGGNDSTQIKCLKHQNYVKDQVT